MRTVSRRFVFWMVITVISLCGYSTAQNAGLAAQWSFDERDGQLARDSVRGTDDNITGLFKHVAGVTGQAVRFDGETTSIKRAAQDSQQITDDLTVEACVAVNTYPWNWVPIIDQSRGEEHRRGERGYSVGIDAFGHLGLQISVDDKFQTLMSKDPLPLKKWTHIAATFANNHGLQIYVNGQRADGLAVLGG